MACLLSFHAFGQDEGYEAKLTNETGTVKYKQQNKEEIQVFPPRELYAQDLVHTLTNSTAVVWMRNDNTLVKMRELSTLQILGPEKSSLWMNLMQGALYFFSRGQAQQILIRTPHGTAAHEGTEFVLTVDKDQTVMVVLDGMASLTNQWGSTNLVSGEMGVAADGRPPVKSRLEAKNLVQWWLYYPGVVDVDELPFTGAERTALSASVRAYRSGDLAGALSSYPDYPAPRDPASDQGKIYLAALYLAQGEVGKCQDLLNNVSTNTSLAQSLRWVIAAVQDNVSQKPQVHTSASEWLGLSYYYQARNEPDRLEKALQSAYNAVQINTNFGFGWERVAELEFGFGKIGQAEAALDKSLKLAPKNAQAFALRGFLFAADNRLTAARQEFDIAIRLDPNLGNAWLGRGLVRIRTRDAAGGISDLKMAVILEPNRSLLRSYLGKAFADAGLYPNASFEFKRAEGLDTNDPTPWLYSALQKNNQNRINEAVDDLQKSVQMNDNRAVYRSQLLLDKDQAVRSANLATIYQANNMNEVAVREAAAAVNYDYANASAHLFLSDAYNDLRDPTQFNLRYETVWFNELLLANLLSPVGGGRLSQTVSQQDYSKLFQQDGLGIANSSDVRSDGMYHQQSSQYGTFGNTAYAVDVNYHHNSGIRVNNSLDDIEWDVTMKQQVTPQDTALALLQYQNYHSGDNFQYYNPANARPYYEFTEYQHPIVFGGWDHEWSPGMRTLALVGRLEDEQYFSDTAAPQLVLDEFPNGSIYNAQTEPYDVDYHNQFTIYSGELNQICQWDRATLTAGARFQAGNFAAQDEFFDSTIPTLFTGTTNSINDNFRRVTGYGYLTVEPLDQVWLTGGLAYDEVSYPDNYRQPPVDSGQDWRHQLGPKAALVWSPIPQVTVRGVYTRSLGGVSLDESYRLEPTELAGFPQAFRSLISETIVGSVAAPTYETAGAALDLKPGPRTFAGIQAQRLTTDVHRNDGDFILQNGVSPGYTPESLNYKEYDLTASVNQLIGDKIVAGASYTIIRSDLHDVLTDVPVSALATAAQIERSTLQQVETYIQFNHPSGFYTRAELHWYGQANSGWTPAEPGDHFFQFNLFAGWFFFRHRAQAQFGLLNLTGQNYELSSLSPYQYLPRSVVYEGRLNFIF